MAAIRHVEICNFRGIAYLSWAPKEGINALIGPGDVGKSTVLEAIDLVLGTRRSTFTDTDFHCLNVEQPISIEVTVGDLPRELLDLELYSAAIRGWSAVTSELADEPGEGLEPVITLKVTVSESCEATWQLHSERLAANELPRAMRNDHRAMIMAQRLGSAVGQHLAWGPTSSLSKLSGSGKGMGAALARAGRAARDDFTVADAPALKPAVTAAQQVARDLAVPAALDAIAALDPRSVNISNGAIALHGSNHVPLRALGTGSSRLLAAGLQAKVSRSVPVLLLDEVEHGLEPHRIARLLHYLGSKETESRPQVIMTTHSPVVLRELSAEQLCVARSDIGKTLRLERFGEAERGLLRTHAEAFLSAAILVCEGPTEIGLMRGFDLFWSSCNQLSLAFLGISLVDGKGTPNAQKTALQFSAAGFEVALLRDSDVPPPQNEQTFRGRGCPVFCWRDGHATENELFDSLPPEALPELIAIADKHHTSTVVDTNLGSHGLNKDSITALRTRPTDAHRSILAKAARSGAWFKRIDFGEEVAREVVCPNFTSLTGQLPITIQEIWTWTRRFAPPNDT
ncbi:ATP-dependent nuclease [Roseomonas sp. BN140053]|uniref:ATP-dependent nuclease n=1 Tax=Roseomonas sp. BN140053 TaxID=3391898 RepID=UPI0039E7FA6F